jgi:hypothetical protein
MELQLVHARADGAFALVAVVIRAAGPVSGP